METVGGERIRLEARRHGIVLLRPFVQASALVVVGLVAFAGGSPLPAVGASLVVVAAGVMLVGVWRWDRTYVVVTTEKLYVVHGTLRRRAAAVRLARLGAIELEQTLLGRVLGYGTLIAGELEIDFVPEPRRVCSLVARVGG